MVLDGDNIEYFTFKKRPQIMHFRILTVICYLLKYYFRSKIVIHNLLYIITHNFIYIV